MIKRMVLLLIHVILALANILYSTVLYFRPSRRKLHVNYGLIAATLASGTYLVISTHSPLLSSCLTGLAYLGIVSVAVLGANRRLSNY